MALAALAQRLYAKRAGKAGILLVIGIVGVVAVLRRLDHHPGDQCALGRRGPGRHHAGDRAPDHADRGRDPDRPVRRAAIRNGQGRRSLRPGHGAVVRRHGGGGPGHGDPVPGRAARPLADLRDRRSSSRIRRSRSSRWAPSSSSSREPRRSTPTWGTSGRSPIRRAWFFLVFPALTINYLGQAALDPAPPRGEGQPVLPADPGVGPAPRRDPGDRRDRHRQPGRHLRSLLAVPAGGLSSVCSRR